MLFVLFPVVMIVVNGVVIGGDAYVFLGVVGFGGGGGGGGGGGSGSCPANNGNGSY